MVTLEGLIPGSNLAILTAVVGFIIYLLKDKLKSLVHPVNIKPGHIFIWLINLLNLIIGFFIILFFIYFLKVIYIICKNSIQKNFNPFEHVEFYLYVFYGLIFLIAIPLLACILYLSWTSKKEFTNYEYRKFPVAKIDKSDKELFLVKELANGDFLATYSKAYLNKEEFILVKKDDLKTGTPIRYKKIK